MRNISAFLSDDEMRELQKNLHDYFETGYAFEYFIKEYLIQMGLDEVEVTQRSRDGGVDLIAIRKGLGDFSNADITNYYIQTKRYALNKNVSVKEVRELKGAVLSGDKAMFITTSDFTKDAYKEADKDKAKQVILINGKSLIASCIDRQIGFLFKPYFSKEHMDRFLKKEDKVSGDDIGSSDAFLFSEVEGVEKEITANDIRARIISIPSAIMKQLDKNLSSIDVIVNNEKTFHCSINRERNYFAGVREIHKQYGLITSDGIIIPKWCKWKYDSENGAVRLFIEK